MNLAWGRLVLISAVAVFFSAALPVEAGSFAGFISALRHSLGHRHHHLKSRSAQAEMANSPEPQRQTLNAPMLPPSPPPEPPGPAPINSEPRSTGGGTKATNARRDLPYGAPVPNREGFVTSPYAPKRGLVDVRGFPSGTEVKDPYTGKVFLTP